MVTQKEENAISVRIIIQNNLKGLGIHFGEKLKFPKVFVKDLEKDGPVAQSGLVEKGDRIIRINDVDVSGYSKTAVKKLLSSFPVGSAVTFTLKCKDGFIASFNKVLTEDGQSKMMRTTTLIKDFNNKKNKPQAPSSVIVTPGNSIYKSKNGYTPQCPFMNDGLTHQPSTNRVRNYIDDGSHVDLLSRSAYPDMKCTTGACSGALMAQAPRRPSGVRPKEELLVHAEDFMKQFYSNSKRLNSDAHKDRWNEVKQTIEQTGTYDLTYEELKFATKTAWRNAPRCIGRIQWSKLQVFDCRHVKTAREMFEAICDHISYATNNGNIRSAITVFPKRTDGEHDFRIWNSQFIKFAGYKQPDGSVIGDPGSVEFTEICKSMGWEGPGTPYDPLPMVLQADGEDPELFELPSDLVLMVNLKHPRFDWFESLGIKWYCVPAVANMCLDAGGLEYTGAPFNGWYMGTEIGARNLCDPQRYNMLHKLGEKMGLDTSRNSSLWKDSVLVEVNIAVLYSFESAGVTIADHHTASESFMKFFSDEFRLRGGCPADWVWVVPPMSGSACPVFHQEMFNYVLKPSYEYQKDPWKTYISKKDREAIANGQLVLKKQKTFRQVALTVRFAAKLMMRALSKRPKCTILYATETGKSETFAKRINEIFAHAFDSKVVCMADYSVTDLAKESLVLVVASTFGNGDAPDNGRTFASSLAKKVKEADQFRHDDSKRDILSLDRMKYSVFALGSGAYIKFCEFGRSVDRNFATLGGERIMDLGEGDELNAQERSFATWATSVFKAACSTFNIADDPNITAATKSLLQHDRSWAPGKFRLAPVTSYVSSSLTSKLKKIHKRNIYECVLTSRKALQAPHSDRETTLVTLDCQDPELQSHSPGDHVALFPANREELVNDVISTLKDAPSFDEELQLQIKKDTDTDSWETDDRLSAFSLRELFTNFLDITSPPSPFLLQQLAKYAAEKDSRTLEKLASDSQLYEDWKAQYSPTLPDVLKQFPSLAVPTALLVSQLPLLQPRYYSISSAPAAVPGEIHATVAVVKYRSKAYPDVVRHGVCSTWLNDLPLGEKIPCYIRVAENFHLPKDKTQPCILVGPGTGIAPFRGFMQQRRVDMRSKKDHSAWGPMTLYFGCRQSKLDNLHWEETQQAKRDGVLSNVYTAYSREPDQPKMYVQDLLWRNGPEVFDQIVNKQGHFYVCGDSVMAGDVEAKLETILCFYSRMIQEEAKEYIIQMRDNNRYHEDIFGVSYRAKETVKSLKQDTKNQDKVNQEASKMSIIEESVSL